MTKNISDTEISISIIINNKLSIASAMNISDRWWISRVNVQESERKKGLGTKLLTELIKQIKDKDKISSIMVAPGGYNFPYNYQVAFYKKNGFISLPDEEGIFVYDNK